MWFFIVMDSESSIECSQAMALELHVVVDGFLNSGPDQEKLKHFAGAITQVSIDFCHGLEDLGLERDSIKLEHCTDILPSELGHTLRCAADGLKTAGGVDVPSIRFLSPR